MEILRKYGVQTDFYFPLIKRDVADFAVSADYTHSAGDVKVSKDGGAAATATNAPSAITMGNGGMWKLTLTATEMQAAKIAITIIDAATKVIEDQMILVSTYGNASGEHAFDLDTATQDVNVASVATGAITAGSIATDAIGAAELAADAVAEIAAAVAAPTAAVIADAVWDEVASGHTTTGTFGQKEQPIRNGTLQNGSANAATLDASASAVDDFYKDCWLYITGGTGAGQVRRIHSYTGSSKLCGIAPSWATTPSGTSVFVVLPITGIPAGYQGIQATSFVADAIDSGALAASAVTEIQSGLATATALNTVDDFLDTEIAAIKAKTDNLPASPAAVSDIPTAAVVADAVWDEAQSGHTTSGTFGQVAQAVRTGTAQAGAAGTVTLDASASATDDFYNGQIIFITAGTGAGQSRRITDYVGSTKVATIQPNWVTNPGATSVFVITPTAYSLLVADAVTAIWGALTSALTTASTIGKLLVDNVNATISSRASQTSVDTVDDFLDTEIAAIKAKTDNLPTDPADASDIAAAFAVTNGKIDVVDDFLDTEIAAIKAKTDNLPTDPADASVIAAAISSLPSETDIADAVVAKALTEPSAVFAWGTATVGNVLAWLGALSRNKMIQTDTTSTLRNDADSADIAESAIADDGTAFTRSEWL